MEGAVLSTAIRIGKVRLIDNLLVGPAARMVSQASLHYSNDRIITESGNE